MRYWVFTLTSMIVTMALLVPVAWILPWTDVRSAVLIPICIAIGRWMGYKDGRRDESRHQKLKTENNCESKS